jgi:hypothetical protein
VGAEIVSEFIHKEAFDLLATELIGRGASRNVFSCALRRDCVVKVEDGAKSFQNIVEWQTWMEVKETPQAKWFAPCVEISPCGSLLVMRRTEPVPKGQLPRRVPAFFTDLKHANFGLLDGRFVCHDYGVNNLTAHGLLAGMAKAFWWELNMDGTVPNRAA